MRLIGWKGFGIDQWFPHSTGRFFSEKEEKDGEMVAYIHHDKYDALKSVCGDSFEIGLYIFHASKKPAPTI